MKLAELWVKTLDPSELEHIEGLQGKWKRFLDASEQSQGMVFGMGELAVGETAGWHDHPEPELFFVLEGTALARWNVDGDIGEERLSPGKAFFKEGDVPHQMVNDGSTVFRGLFFKLGAV